MNFYKITIRGTRVLLGVFEAENESDAHEKLEQQGAFGSVANAALALGVTPEILRSKMDIRLISSGAASWTLRPMDNDASQPTDIDDEATQLDLFVGY